jgi:adenosylcobinamide-phosphate synthase
MTAPRLALAYALDLLLGDPEWFPHPVRGLGYLVSRGERWLRSFARGPRTELMAGAALTCSVTSIGWALGRPKNPAWQVLLAWTALATRSLLHEAEAVIRALEAGDLPLARRRLSRIVGRDTAHLDETEISRAVIETLVIPARLTAAAIVTAAKLQGRDAEGAHRIWRRDGDKHASPNAGQSEAAMAGALGVRLGGTSSYDAHPHHTPVLNPEGRRAAVRDARAALSLAAIVSGLAFGAAVLAIAARNKHARR